MCSGSRNRGGGSHPVVFESPEPKSALELSLAKASVFSMGHALYVSGLIKYAEIWSLPKMRKQTTGRWGNPARQPEFWEALAEVGLTEESLAEVPRELSRPMAGAWMCEDVRRRLFDLDVSFVTDLRLTMTVLSRMRGPVYYPRAVPDYSWQNLFRGFFHVRNHAVSGVPFTDPIWPQDQLESRSGIYHTGKIYRYGFPRM